MKISKIEPQKRRKKRYSIWIDGEYSFSCDKEILFKLGIEEGQEFSSSELETLLTEIQKREAQAYSLGVLARRPFSEAGLKSRLRSRGYDSHITSSTIGYLKSIGLIDDLNYSRLWIRSRAKINPKGSLLLRRELRIKGIAPPTIEKALEESKEFYDEGELLVQVAERRAEKLKNLDPISKRRRLSNYLLRRGFPIDEVREITQKY